MNIVIPLAGKDARFESKGVCKPLAAVEGKPLIKFCTDSLPWPFAEEKYTLHFLILREHDEKYSLGGRLSSLYPSSQVHVLEKPTRGAACTVLAIRGIIGSSEELIIYLADIYFQGEIRHAFRPEPEGDGIIPVFESQSARYSYALVGKGGKVEKVAEKRAISRLASAGFYYFRQGSAFVKAADAMIAANDSVNSAFYICPVYNYLRPMDVVTLPVRFIRDFGHDDFTSLL